MMGEMNNDTTSATPATSAKTLPQNIRVLVMAGGTGGHVFPALAVAQALRSAGDQVSWLGTRRGLESHVVPGAGFDISYIAIGGLRGKSVLTLVFAPFKLVIALLQSLIVMMVQKPDVVLGMGGFVTGPGGVAARIMRKPLLIHEQNAIAGMTNKLLSNIATQALQAFPGAFDDQSNPQTVGNPVRPEIAALESPEERYSQRDDALRLLIVGGSLGAVALNENVPPAIGMLSESKRPQIWHQTGRNNRKETEKFYGFAKVDAKVVEFISDMADAYSWADLVICRSGALTVAELAAAGVASILVPYPYAVDDHQTVNAKSLTDAGAGLLIQQENLTPRHLHEVLKSFTDHEMHESRDRLKHMALAARGQAKTNATQDVVAWCRKLGQQALLEKTDAGGAL